MFGTGKRKTEKKEDGNEQQDIKRPAVQCRLHKSLNRNIAMFKTLFTDDDTLIARRFENRQADEIKCCILFIEGMIKHEIVNENIIKPVVMGINLNVGRDLAGKMMNQVIISDNVEKTADVNRLLEAIVNGDTVLLIEGVDEALAINSKGWSSRSVEEPESEKSIRGPRDGFNESIMMNLSMIRRRILSHDLKFKFRTMGLKSNTRICICYVDDIVNKKILLEVQKRLDRIEMDAILESGFIQELIKDAPLSPFKTVGSTERPDVIAAKLLEGRIAVLVDGSPVAITMPHTFIEYFQANEDYYINFYFSSISRMIRIMCFIITTGLPAVFISLITYHQELVPTPLIISIAAARHGVPFPSTVELFVLLVVFEILREAGTRMPTAIGQAFSIVGTLVIGQAAVDARFVSAPMVIISALTGITGLAIPKVKGASILLRFIFLFLASILGLYGFMFGLIGLMIHLFDLRSFGVPYMLGMMNLNPEDVQDTAIRAPWIYMRYRPKFIAANNRFRNATRGNKK